VLHHFSASSLAMVELVGTLPALLCMPFAGAIAVRRDVRRLALGSMTVAGLLAVTGVRTVGVVAGGASVLVGAAWWALNGRRARPLYLSATSAAGAPDHPGTVAAAAARSER